MGQVYGIKATNDRKLPNEGEAAAPNEVRVRRVFERTRDVSKAEGKARSGEGQDEEVRAFRSGRTRVPARARAQVRVLEDQGAPSVVDPDLGRGEPAEAGDAEPVVAPLLPKSPTATGLV